MLTSLFLASLAFSKTSASSVVSDADGKHPADLAADGLLTTGWGEGASGYGEGAWWELDLGSTTELQSLSIWPGNLKQGARSYREYSRPKRVKILVDGVAQGDVFNIPEDQMQRVDIPLTGSGKKLRIECVEVYEGYVYADLYLAEVAVNYVKGDRARAVEKIDAWRLSNEGQKAQAKYDEQVLAAFDAHKANSDDLDSLKFLMDAAADGPEYLRKRVDSLVPDGYRAHAIQPDQKAMLAIRKLKNPYAIPGLESAQLRAVGKEQKEIREIVEIFYAYQDLVGGGRRNIKAWGEPGWEVGALQSFGEPLSIEIDRFGDSYVADTGNNRIQKYDQAGVSQRRWGAQPDAANQWFNEARRWYAAGSAAVETQGGFVNTVDIELIPGKEADSFAVLDARGRVQVFDEEGNPIIGWTADIDHQMQAKVGGEGYLAWLPKKKALVLIIGNQGRVYNLEAEELARWKMQDGTPNGVEVGKDGKLYVVYGQRVVTYNATDGFRYEEVMGTGLLGEGYEDMDISIDEEQRLWVLTDTGWVYKFKKPGKLEWKVKISDVELIHPRFAVSQGFLYITDRDRIVRVDALQLHMDEEQAEEGAAGGAEK